MTIPTTLGYDAIRVNAAQIPKGAQAAGYTTGSGIVPWDQAAWDAHPGAVRIDQDPAASDPTADILDVETGAATLADCAPWSQKALASFRSGTRHGQRSPAIYTSASNVTPVVNALIRGGIHSGVGLWVANWSLSQSQAEALVASASGPFPVIGVQYDDHGPQGQPIDSDIFSVPWLRNVSGAAPPPQGQPPAAPESRATGGNESLRAFAHYHGMSVEQVLWLTATRKPGGFGTEQGGYVSGGRWDDHMPAGSTWWIGPTP